MRPAARQAASRQPLAGRPVNGDSPSSRRRLSVVLTVTLRGCERKLHHGEKEKGRAGRPGADQSLPLHADQPREATHDLAGELAPLRVDHHHHHHGQLCRHGPGRQTVQQRQVHHVNQTGEFNTQLDGLEVIWQICQCMILAWTFNVYVSKYLYIAEYALYFSSETK